MKEKEDLPTKDVTIVEDKEKDNEIDFDVAIDTRKKIKEVGVSNITKSTTPKKWCGGK